jgi:hypothetical protein
MYWLNGLSTPLWVLMSLTLLPHMVSAIAALSSSSSDSWKAASSMTTSPCKPRKFDGRLDSADFKAAEAKRIM